MVEYLRQQKNGMFHLGPSTTMPNLTTTIGKINIQKKTKNKFAYIHAKIE
jgi:hypothetical protein